jgi:hypothetical protein
VRVRTYGFPGVLRGRPGPRLATTPTNRPRRSLSSPGMCLQLKFSRRLDLDGDASRRAWAPGSVADSDRASMSEDPGRCEHGLPNKKPCPMRAGTPNKNPCPLRAGTDPQRAHPSAGEGTAPTIKTTRPGPLEEPAKNGPRAILAGGAASHLSGLALCGSVPRLN